MHSGGPFIGRRNTSGKSILSACILTSGIDDRLSPKKKDELRCGAIENDNVSGEEITSGEESESECAIEEVLIQQNADRVCQQLKANMLLCSVNQFALHAKKPNFATDKLDLIKCYGLTVCFPPLPIVLLELTVDFSEHTYEYKELFRCNTLYPYTPILVDCALEYIINRVSV